MKSYGDTDLGQQLNDGSGNGLVPDGTKPLPRLLISEILWHEPESNFTASSPTIIMYNECENYTLKITITFPRGQ